MKHGRTKDGTAIRLPVERCSRDSRIVEGFVSGFVLDHGGNEIVKINRVTSGHDTTRIELVLGINDETKKVLISGDRD